MKVTNVLLACTLLGVLFLPSRAAAQIEDDFANAFDIAIPWTFNVPGNNPTNTEDPGNYAFSANSLDITAEAGTFYSTYNNAYNIPNLVIYGQPANWYIETMVSTDWTMASTDAYVSGKAIASKGRGNCWRRG